MKIANIMKTKHIALIFDNVITLANLIKKPYNDFNYD